MASIPNKIEKVKDLECDPFTTIAQANWQKVASLLEYANRSFPVGMLLYFYASQDLIPAAPDPKYWKFMDGTMIVNPDSVLNGLVVPDLRGKFFKHPGTGDTYPSIGGADSLDLTHNHTGFTAFATDYGAVELDDGAERSGAGGSHRHAINNGFGTVTIIPAYAECQVYMRIA